MHYATSSASWLTRSTFRSRLARFVQPLAVVRGQPDPQQISNSKSQSSPVSPKSREFPAMHICIDGFVFNRTAAPRGDAISTVAAHLPTPFKALQRPRRLIAQL